MEQVNRTSSRFEVLKAAHQGDAGRANIPSRRVRTRTISELQTLGLLYSKGIDGLVPLTPRGLGVFLAWNNDPR